MASYDTREEYHAFSKVLISDLRCGLVWSRLPPSWFCVCDVLFAITAFATAPDYAQQHLPPGVESDFCSAECEVYLAVRAY